MVASVCSIIVSLPPQLDAAVAAARTIPIPLHRDGTPLDLSTKYNEGLGEEIHHRDVIWSCFSLDF